MLTCKLFPALTPGVYCRFPLGAVHYGFVAAEQLMKRERRNGFPDTPHSFDELNEILNQPKWVKFRNDCSGQSFYREMVLAEDGSQCAVWISPRLQELMTVANWKAHADGTFDSAPAHPPSRQLFSVHALDNDAYGDVKRVRSVIPDRHLLGW